MRVALIVRLLPVVMESIECVENRDSKAGVRDGDGLVAEIADAS